MTKEEMKNRTKNYAIANARLVLSLPNNIVNRNYADQLTEAPVQPERIIEPRVERNQKLTLSTN